MSSLTVNHRVQLLTFDDNRLTITDFDVERAATEPIVIVSNPPVSGWLPTRTC